MANMNPRPTYMPDWAMIDQSDPESGQNNVAYPPLTFRQYGHGYQSKPPRQFDNWKGRMTSQWLRYFDETFISKRRGLFFDDFLYSGASNGFLHPVGWDTTRVGNFPWGFNPVTGTTLGTGGSDAGYADVRIGSGGDGCDGWVRLGAGNQANYGIDMISSAICNPGGLPGYQSRGWWNLTESIWAAFRFHTCDDLDNFYMELGLVEGGSPAGYLKTYLSGGFLYGIAKGTMTFGDAVVVGTIEPDTTYNLLLWTTSGQPTQGNFILYDDWTWESQLGAVHTHVYTGDILRDEGCDLFVRSQQLATDSGRYLDIDYVAAGRGLPPLPLA